MSCQADLLPGALDLTILEAVPLGDVHRHGVLLRIEQISNGGAGDPAGCALSGVVVTTRPEEV